VPSIIVTYLQSAVGNTENKKGLET